MRIFVLAAAGCLGVCGALAGAQSASHPVSSACVGTWSPPSPLRRADGNPVWVDWDGTATTVAGKSLVLGPTLFWMRADRPFPRDGVLDTAQAIWSVTRAGATVDPSGVAVAVPMVDSLKLHARARLVAWSPRSIEVAWSVSDSARPDPNTFHADRIELASFDGVRWTDTATILRGEDLRLNLPTVVRAGTAFDQRVVVAQSHDSHGELVRLARRVGNAWQTSEWRPPGDLILLQALPALDGSTVIVGFGSLPSVGNGVFAQRLTTRSGGDVWSAPERIDTLPGSFGPPVSARLGGDSLVVVWEEAVVEAVSDHLQTALSVDGGVHWRLMKPIPFDQQVRGTRLVVDTRGRLHLLAGLTSGRRGAKPETIVHALWNSDGWTAPDVVVLDFGYVSVVPMDDGRLMTEWGGIEMTPGGMGPRSWSSVWSPSCVR